MTLIEAVNLCLRSTGESNIAALDSNHPQISVILAEIDTVSQRIQRRGWWFNTALRVLTPVTTGPFAGQIDVSDYDLVVPTRRALDYFPLGGWLVDRRTGEPVRDTSVQAWTRQVYPTNEVTWNSLPDSFTDYVATAAALSYASNYDADELQLQKLQVALAQAQALANADHTRYSRVNLYHSGSAGQALSRARGNRYGVYR